MMTRLITLAVGIALLLGVLFYANPHQVIKLVSIGDKPLLLLSIFISFLALVLRALKWKILVGSISLPQLLPVQTLGIAISSLTPAKVAEPVKALILRAVTGVPVARSLPTIIWERVLDLLVLLLFASLAFYHFASHFWFASLVFLTFLLVIALLLASLKLEQMGKLLLKICRFLRIRVDERFLRIFYTSRVKTERIIASFFVTLVVWLLDGLVFYFCLLAIWKEVSIGYATIVAYWAFSLLAGLLSSLPGGIGSADAVMVFLLLMEGVEQSIAGASVLLARAMTLGLGMLAGYISLLYLRRRVELLKTENLFQLRTTKL